MVPKTYLGAVGVRIVFPVTNFCTIGNQANRGRSSRSLTAIYGLVHLYGNDTTFSVARRRNSGTTGRRSYCFSLIVASTFKGELLLRLISKLCD